MQTTIFNLLDNCLTNGLQLIVMKEQKATVREFLRNYKKFSKAKVATVIFNRSEPEGVFLPYEEWEKGNCGKPKTTMSLAEAMKKFTFRSGIKNLSDPREIDKTCYLDD